MDYDRLPEEVKDFMNCLKNWPYSIEHNLWGVLEEAEDLKGFFDSAIGITETLQKECKAMILELERLRREIYSNSQSTLQLVPLQVINKIPVDVLA